MVERRPGLVSAAELARADSGLGTAHEPKINYKLLEKRVDLIDFDNPPEGLVILSRLPDAATDYLMRNMSQPLLPQRRRRTR